MRKFLHIASILVVSFYLAACQIKPVQYAGTAAPEPKCSTIRTRIMIDPADEASARGGALVASADTLTDRIVATYERAAGEPMFPESHARGPVSASMLFLSGGSQNGAFGAGYLSEWAKLRTAAGKPGGLPRFRVVTGISTGALQSTFAFLGDTDEILRRYSITHESELLAPFVKNGLKGGGLFGTAKAGVTVARRGAIADLAPLRGQLRTLITDARLRAVAAEAKDRYLLVGAVEMDTGDAYVFDLTRAATLYAEGDSMMRDCYIEALMASSSVPLAALPVFIDGRMYIDGGARFGVISDFQGTLMEKVAPRITDTTQKNLFILVNGTLEAGEVCHLNDCEKTPRPGTPDGAIPQHSSWSFDGLAFRSLSILINQSYRSSVYWVTKEARERGFNPHFVRIRKDVADHEAKVGLAPDGDMSKTCDQWRKRDKELDAPLEFHPRFMRCVIDYGRKRKEVAIWAERE